MIQIVNYQGVTMISFKQARRKITNLKMGINKHFQKPDTYTEHSAQGRPFQRRKPR